MASFLEDRMRLFRFLSVIHFVGTSFLKLCCFTSGVKRYVCGEKEEIVVDGERKRLDGEDESFAREVEGFFLFVSWVRGCRTWFPRFPQLQFKFWEAIGNDTCYYTGEVQDVREGTSCGSQHSYRCKRGSYLGSRVTKCCRTCKVYEHYCYWTQKGKRHFNDDCVSDEFLLSTEDIAQTY